MPARRRILSLVMLAAAVLSVAGCDLTRIEDPRSWTQTEVSAGGQGHLIAVSDLTGRVDNVEIDPPGLAASGGVANPPGQANVVIVPWTGGACDERTDIRITTNGTDLVVAIAAKASAGACDDVGVLHAIRITGHAPIPAATVTIGRRS